MIPTFIMHVREPERLAVVRRLKQHIPSAQVMEDKKRSGPWHNCRRILVQALHHKNTARHVLILQDDIQLCKDFAPAVEIISELVPNAVIGFFSMRKKLLEARDRQIHWCSGGGVWGQAVLFPIAMIPDFLLWERQYFKPECYHDDTRISVWADYNNVTCLTTSPTLVEHIGAATSSVGNSNRKRVSPYFAGDTSALDYDWTKGLDKPVRMSSTLPKDRIRPYLYRYPWKE